MTDLIVQEPGALSIYTRETISVEDAIKLWLAKYRSQHTRRAYAGEVAAFAKFLRRETQEAMAYFLALEHHQAHTLIDAYKALMIQRDKPRSPSTINRSLAALSSFVRSARRHGLTTLALEFEPVTAGKVRDTRGPKPADIQKMVRHAQAQFSPWKAARDAAMIRLMFALALRRSEVSSLDLEHVDFHNNTVSVLGKARTVREPRTVPEAVMQLLRAWIAQRGEHPGALFLAVDSGERIAPGGVAHIIGDAGRRIGLTVRAHGIRHSAITAVLDASSGDVRKAKKFARHTSAETTLIYDDNREDLAGSAAKMIDALVE